MEAPAVTRNRRPFLAPVWLTLLAAFLALVVAFVIFRSATTTVVVLVCPADKDAGMIDDPPLSPDGELRAQKLAEMLGGSSGVGALDAIYVANARRAQQEITPLADRLNKKPEVIAKSDIGSIAGRLTHGHDSETVLYVGSSAVVGQLVHELAGADVTGAGEREHDTMYVVSLPRFGRSRVLKISY